ncbi:MAG: amylo-alpha-1,6-glucosidase [Chitinophagaceae bacterium]
MVQALQEVAMLKKGKDQLQNFEEAARYESLETNGLGGWSGSSVIGLNTRRYHGLLVASIVPPVDRMVLLNKLDETIVLENKRIDLGANLFEGDVAGPQGYHFLQNFCKDIFPHWVYEAEGIQLNKTIAMIHGENTVVITYDIVKSPSSFTMELLPFISGRDYHSLLHDKSQLNEHCDFNNGLFHSRPDNKTDIFIHVPEAGFQPNPIWIDHFHYREEKFRGHDCTEDLFSPGKFSVVLKEGDLLRIILSTEDPLAKNPYALLAKETLRRKVLSTDQPADELLQQLVLAADQFIVKRNIKTSVGSQVSPMEGVPIAIGIEGPGATIIAGYPWFTDWSRDTMISLPGLCLSTGRYEDAKKIITSFSQSVSMGMLPNRFQDHGGEPEYNTVDGTLWYFIAIHKYLVATNDVGFILHEILPVLKEIIDWHFKGTRYNIHVDEDGLLYAGEPGQQLTWMDARIGDRVFTPRMGKPVEIQALWYNALKIFAGLLQMNNQSDDASIVLLSAEKARQSFIEKFWYAEGKYLYDNIDENNKADNTLRPNQLLAISLPFPLLEGEKIRSVLNITKAQLYTPVGLRTLSPNDPRYVPTYEGDIWARDSAYHQGTAWSWMLGPYIDAIMTEANGREKAMQVIKSFNYHLYEACIGSVSEIFDGNFPHRPKGCVAQAWGVAELLRVISQYELYEINNKSPIFTNIK